MDGYRCSNQTTPSRRTRNHRFGCATGSRRSRRTDSGFPSGHRSKDLNPSTRLHSTSRPSRPSRNYLNMCGSDSGPDCHNCHSPRSVSQSPQHPERNYPGPSNHLHSTSRSNRPNRNCLSMCENGSEPDCRNCHSPRSVSQSPQHRERKLPSPSSYPRPTNRSSHPNCM